MSDPVLLIHGAWQGSWAWARLVPLLQAKGLHVICADLPGNGADGTDPRQATLHDCLTYLEDLIAPYGAVSVIGHSGGGLVAGALAERCEKVARLAYVAGMMLPAGLSFSQVQSEISPQVSHLRGITPHLVWSKDGLVSTVPRPAAEAIFFSDCSIDDARAAAARLTPQGPGTRGFSPATSDRVATLPRLYVAATGDLSVPIALQRHMMTLMPGAQIAELPTGHVPQFSAPAQLSRALLPFLCNSEN